MSPSNEVRQAILGLLTAMLVIDGESGEAENRRLIGHVKAHPLFAGMTDEELSALSRAGVAEVRRNGAFATFARWAVAVPPDLTETTFELVIRAMLADGVLHDREGAFGDALRDALKISKARALEIADRVAKERESGGGTRH
jgi:Arc/MetJ family transcription regulator